MRTDRLNEEKIIGVLHEAGTGREIASEKTDHRRKQKYSALQNRIAAHTHSKLTRMGRRGAWERAFRYAHCLVIVVP